MALRGCLSRELGTITGESAGVFAISSSGVNVLQTELFTAAGPGFAPHGPEMKVYPQAGSVDSTGWDGFKRSRRWIPSLPQAMADQYRSPEGDCGRS